MNRSEIIRSLAEKDQISIEDATIIVNIFFDSIKKALVNDDRVEIRGFGSFKMKNYGRYSGRNPKTGQTVHVECKKLPFFRVGKELKEYINS